ncbi:MAG TPA: glycosyltransferase family 2 protein, partial [Flavobacteriaceae bacterium]|nr:glycosyltransferase family 2 protein [Flavobacteriaceae bacterium]
MPVYQEEQGLKKCLDSILSQTFQDFEIILINDGSTDKSGDICEEYVAAHKNIKVFHQENKGPSAARNKGIDEANGQYITFIDADDFVEPKYLESFFLLEKEPKETVVMQGIILHRPKNEKKIRKLPLGIYDSNEFSNLFYSLRLISTWPYAVCKLYNRKIIEEKSIKFVEDLKYGEDLLFFLDYFQFIEKMILIDQCNYHYLYTPKSLSWTLHGYESEIKLLNKVSKRINVLDKKIGFSAEIESIHQAHFSKYFYR